MIPSSAQKDILSCFFLSFVVERPAWPPLLLAPSEQPVMWHKTFCHMPFCFGCGIQCVIVFAQKVQRMRTIRSFGSHTTLCEKSHTHDSVRKDSWTEAQEQVLARRPGANANQLLQPWVTGLWLGRDTLSDEHLLGTAVGVVGSRGVRRLQEPARWVPEALKAMLFTPWSQHLNLPGRPRLQRPAYEEPLEAELCQDSSRPQQP